MDATDPRSIETLIEKVTAHAGESQDSEPAAASVEAEHVTEPTEEPSGSDEPKQEHESHDEAAHQAFLEMGRKLGYKLDKGDVKRVTSGERKAFQRRLAKFNEEYSGGVADLERRAGELAERYSRFAKAEQSLEMGDMDNVAKSLGYEDWNDLNVAYIKKKTSPHHQELQAIKQKLAEKERQEEEQAAQTAAEREAREAHEAEQEYAEELEVHFAQSDEFSEWAEDPDFIGAVISIQRDNYQDGATIDAAEAGRMALDAAWGMYKKLHSRFGKMPGNGATAAQSPSNGATAGKKVISQRDAVSASGIKPTKGMSENEWFDHYAKLLAASNR